MARVTSRDVAAAAGVSRATVSYVLNDAAGRRVSPATRRRVLDTARRLGYTPHGGATALRTGRTTIVLLALPDWPLGPPMAAAITAAVAELERLGYTPLVHFGDAESLARACARARPVGVIAPAGALGPAQAEALRGLGARGIVALAGASPGHVPAFVFDQAAVGRTGLAHLAGRGHTAVLAVMPDEAPFAELARERLGGARAEGAARRVRVTALVTTAARLSEELPAALGDRTAVLAFNDEYALAALGALADAGRAVPGDVAVCGADDSSAARHARPRLTTIELVAPARWRELARRLDRAIAGEPVEDLVAQPTLVPGDTT